MIDIDGYNRDQEHCRSVQKRLDRVIDKLEAWKRACNEVSITASAAGGDVKVTVAANGRMTGIEIVEGTMAAYTHQGLEERINQALKGAQKAARHEVAEIDDMIGTGDFVAAFDQGVEAAGT
ncbi:hypothetical protein AWC17_25140 [Mycobacterium nebraskense]|uniref:DNA-binding protein n=1 Tax=Mycobacterium nebraskense TaxID=244292 RepID=A0A1X1ZZ88_9MYCO|nr:YbaB/EbfC family nucleoid-associated protein [Mycobacterium nebraskense]ORW32695.1 hypothetical protein AWC17_25140 [Mycobacterium nebraskense]